MTTQENQSYNVSQREDVYDAFNELTPSQLEQLSRYAKMKAKSVSPEYSWEDLIQEVFAFAYGVGGAGNQYKNWQKDTCDLVLFFKRGIDNIVDHYLRKFDNIHSMKRTDIDEGESDNIGPAELEQSNNANKDPALINIKDEGLLEFYEYVNTLSTNDMHVGKVLDCLLDGIWQPRKISELTGLQLKEINNAKKRLGRDEKLKTFCSSLGVKSKK